MAGTASGAAWTAPGSPAKAQVSAHSSPVTRAFMAVLPFGREPSTHYSGFQGLLPEGEKPALLEERTDLTPEIVKYMVRNGVYTMPPARKTEISDDDLDALAAYLSKTKADAR